MTVDTKHATWMQGQRGIEPETLEKWGVYSEGGKLCIPYAGTSSTKQRLNVGVDPGPEDKPAPRFIWDPPMAAGTQPLYTPPGGITPGLPVLLCEGETDTWRTWQELVKKGGREVNVVGLPGLNAWREDHAQLFEEAPNVYVCLDSDTGYEVRTVADSTFAGIKAALGRRALRVRLPSGPGDLVEFWDTYGVEAFEVLIANSKKYTGRFKPLDFSEPPPVYDWLWEGYLAVPDLGFLVGPPGSAKSWLSMAMAVAVVEGWSSLLGVPFHGGQGSVVYVDQENPEDVVRNRLAQLGLTEAGQERLKFLHFQGVKLDDEQIAQDFVDYVEFEQPRLVVIDSLSAVHTGNENSAQDMLKVWNQALELICRKLKIPVVILHHMSKPQRGAPPTPRGSTSIMAMADAVWRTFGDEITDLGLVQEKTRRGAGLGALGFGVLDNVEHGVKTTMLVPHAKAAANKPTNDAGW